MRQTNGRRQLFFAHLSIIVKMANFSERLKELREERGLTKKDLAKEVGLADTAIGKWELRQRTANIDAVIALAKFFGVKVGYLVGTEDLP